MSPSPLSLHGSDCGSDIDLPDNLNPTTNDLSSDYGSDIDLTDPNLLNLLDNPSVSRSPSPLYPQLPTEDDFTGLTETHVKASTRFCRGDTLVVQYDKLVTAARPTTTITTTEEAAVTLTTTTDAQPEADPADTIPPIAVPKTRSPYDRFRARRGQLSVTDLISGVWCEQQFMYTLERGFKRRTPAMRKGTKLHKVLEEQVHETVMIETKTREDIWGLKIFNMYQGLVSLDEKGMTRELEVFGWLEGVLVNGIIDEITYSNPDPGILQQTQGRPQTSTSDTGDDSFTTCPSSPLSVTSFPQPTISPPRIAYITDTKTRTTRTIPKESQQLSTSLQLTIYHTLLTSLPSVPFSLFLEHHDLSPTEPFSDRFIAQIASMGSSITLPELLANNSMTGLWNIFLAQYRRTIGSVGNVVGVTYRSQLNGDVIAERSWKVEEEAREKHITDVMNWWRGRRETKGVEIEEAWKCRICEFEDTCGWRLAKLEEIRRIMKAPIEEKKVDVVVEARVEADETKEVKKKSKGRPRKNAERLEEVAGISGSESTGSEVIKVNTKRKGRGRSSPKNAELPGEAGESKGKGKRVRGTSKKEKTNSVG